VWRRRSWVNFSLKSRDVIYVRPLERNAGNNRSPNYFWEETLFPKLGVSRCGSRSAKCAKIRPLQTVQGAYSASPGPSWGKAGLPKRRGWPYKNLWMLRMIDLVRWSLEWQWPSAIVCAVRLGIYWAAWWWCPHWDWQTSIALLWLLLTWSQHCAPWRFYINTTTGDRNKIKSTELKWNKMKAADLRNSERLLSPPATLAGFKGS